MGRKRIKKKDSVLPFRETVAYRVILAGVGFILFLIASIQTIRSIQLGNTAAIVISGLVSVLTIAFTVYNLKGLQDAKVPRSAAQRLKRHR